MPRPNRDRVMVSFYMDQRGKAAVEQLAAERGQSKADTYRELLYLGLRTAAQRRRRKEKRG